MNNGPYSYTNALMVYTVGNDLIQVFLTSTGTVLFLDMLVIFVCSFPSHTSRPHL